jgi:uncharacterized protein YggE
MKKQNILMILIASLFFALTIKAQTIDVTKAPTVKVTGTAEIQVVPDEVNFSLRVRKSDKNLTTAKAQNDEGVRKILELVKRFNLAPADVKTDYISVSEKYDRVKQEGDDEYTEIFAGYTVSKTVIVKLRNVIRFEEFFSAIVGAGISEIGNVSFESSQLRKYRDQARAMAMRAAKEKAEALAKEIGQTIGKAISIEEENTGGGSYSYSQNVNSNVRSNTSAINGSDSDGGTFSVGTISVKAQVEVEFLLY